jgi:hypothetical protein
MAQFCSMGSQCEKVITKSIGTRCNLVPTVKTKYVQASATMRNQGTGSHLDTQDCSTQMDKTDTIVSTSDKAVWVCQSPSAVGRHMQTEEKVVLDKKINTEQKVAHTVGTQVEVHVPHLWSDLVELENNSPSGSVCNLESSSHTNIRLGLPEDDVDQVGMKSQRSEADWESSHTPPCRWVGVSGLSTLLQTLEVPCSSMDQFARNVQNKKRNLKAKGVVVVENSEQAATEYWAVFDDISVAINNSETTLATGRYVKMYGQYQSLMDDKTQHSKYSLADPSSGLFLRCEILAVMELSTILPQVRSKQTGRYGWGGGRQHEYDSSQGGYGSSRSYQAYGGYGGHGIGHGAYGGYGGGKDSYGGGYRGSYRTYRD